MEFEKHDSAGYLANHLARLFARELQARIRPFGLSIGTFPVLLELWEEEGLTQRQLVQRLDVEQATMANTLARMERDGLVRRQPDATDGRIQRIHLTDRARALRAPSLAAAQAVNGVALGNLTREERAQFLGLMRMLIDALRRHGGWKG
jgi:DNA-binding MarR family transcriptional regulator